VTAKAIPDTATAHGRNRSLAMAAIMLSLIASGCGHGCSEGVAIEFGRETPRGRQVGPMEAHQKAAATWGSRAQKLVDELAEIRLKLKPHDWFLREDVTWDEVLALKQAYTERFFCASARKMLEIPLFLWLIEG